jgi:hypothetical protein
MKHAFKSITLRRSRTTDMAEYRALEHQRDEPISLKDLIPNHLYEVDARNFSLGVWDEKVQGFWGARYKMGCRYLACEYLAREGGGNADGYDTATPCLLVGPIPPSIVWSPDTCAGQAPLLNYLRGLES